MTAQEAYIALNLIAGIGPVRVRALLERFGSPQAILSASRSELEQVDGIGAEVAGNISGWRTTVDLQKELQRIEQEGVTVLTPEDAAYPKPLREIYDPPLALYVKGCLSERDNFAIAIVGSRRASLYGQEMARKLAYQLAAAGVTVISGLARGIDTAAHQGALQARGRTIAVLGCGVDVAYPPENRQLRDKILAGGGVLVSEFPMGTAPDRQNFPIRNRIISGMSLGVVVVEAGLGSGALITAAQANEQGRLVFAVPGRADSPLARGSNKLIKDGAKLTEDVDDILGEFSYLLPATQQCKPAVQAPVATTALSATEQQVLAALGEEERTVDEIIRASGLTSATVSATLLALEMKRVVKQLPGRLYIRNPAWRMSA